MLGQQLWFNASYSLRNIGPTVIDFGVKLFCVLLMIVDSAHLLGLNFVCNLKWLIQRVTFCFHVYIWLRWLVVSDHSEIPRGQGNKVVWSDKPPPPMSKPSTSCLPKASLRTVTFEINIMWLTCTQSDTVVFRKWESAILSTTAWFVVSSIIVHFFR